METDPKSPNWQLFCQLTTKQLVHVSQALTDELKRRAEAVDQVEQKRALYLALVRSVELRAHLRELLTLEASAPPVPDAQHGAAQPGAPAGVLPRRRWMSTTAGGAEALRPPLPPADHNATSCSCELCRNVRRVVRHSPFTAQCERCKLDLGHEGECRPVAELDGGSPSSALTAERRGQPGPKGAEGVGEADRAKKGPVELAHHLALLKGGAA